MDGRCLDDAADRAFGAEPTPQRPRRRRFRRRPIRHVVSADPDRPAEPTDDEEPAGPQS
ncbi:MAG: hypothetical protein AB1Z57_06620 [Acidimicrobiia bacterium]